MAWPKTLLFPDGLRVQVDSWAEIKEARAELGPELTVIGGDVEGHEVTTLRSPSAGSHRLSPHDRSVLQQFIEAGSRGVLTQTLGNAIGSRGKGVRPALERWTRRIGLVTEENATAFEQVKRYDGRGFRMVDHYIRAATEMLGR